MSKLEECVIKWQSTIHTVSSNVNIAIWTDNDLDGAGSALALLKVYKDKIKNLYIKDVSDYTFVGEFKGWVETNYDKYDVIFITDLFVPDELIPHVDRPKVVIIDHHQTHIDVKDRIKHAKTIIEPCTSCTKLIRQKFEKVLEGHVSLDLAELFDIIDDYDCYELKYPETLKLNAVYHSYNKPRTEKFIARFGGGINPFNLQELNAIKLSFNKLKDLIDTAEFFEGELKGCRVVSCVAEHSINEIAHYALKHFNADIAIVVIPKTQGVSFRKSKTCPIKLNKLSEIMCRGGGHEYAAGGKITDAFLKFTTTLKPCR